MKMPHDLTAEQAVLGAILIDPGTLPTVLDILPTPDMFYSTLHQRIYTSMLAIFSAGEDMDIVVLAEKIGGDGKALRIVADSTPTSANAPAYARIVRNKAIARRIIKACYEGVTLAGDETIELDERIAAIEAEIHTASDMLFTGTNKTMRELAHQCMNHYGEGMFSNLKTGFYDLDNHVGGFRPGEMIVCAGRTGLGKTTFCLDIARHVAARDIPVQIFSLEMSAERIFNRLACAQGSIPGFLFRQGKADPSQVLNAAAAVHRLPITVYDRRVTTAEIKAMCLRQKNLGLVVVDFITLIKDKRVGNVSTADHIGEIAKRLQEIAKELNVPMVVASQMNRQIESRSEKQPNLSDLRDSGNIEEAADMVLFLHREGYYDKNISTDRTAKVIIAKNRDGPTGAVEVTYLDYIPTFRNLARGGDSVEAGSARH